jgi:glycosyltransferase involved in cell wall biosynthesis
MNINNKHDIVFILPLLSGGGAERVSINLLKGLQNHGYSVGIITFDNSRSFFSMVLDDIPIYNLNTISLRYSIIPLIKKIKYLKPKVIFSTLGYINVLLLFARWALPQKVEIWIREANLPSISIPNNAYPKAMNAFYWMLCKTADKMICTSERMKDEFVFDYRVSKEIIKILPNPVDVDEIHKSVLSIKRFDRGGVCYVAAGRLVFQKGFDRLLHWFSELKGKEATLVILGEGALENELIDMVILLNLQGRVKFVGFCKNPWNWYAGADAFLLSSRWEGMPNVVLESLACGTPVIATEESGGVEEICRQGKNNSVITVTKPQQFIKAMEKVKIKDKNFELKSLLPDRYIKENVIHTFKGWIDELK